MKQVIRRVIDKKRKVQLEEVPCPQPGDRDVLVESAYSLISTGTEGGTISRTPLALTKEILQDPWRRRVVKDIVFSGGLLEAGKKVLDELYAPRILGYSCSGTVISCGRFVEGIKVGDKVAVAGQGHAEVVCTPTTMVSRIPDGVPLREGAFGTLGAIALQSVRRGEIVVGEKVIVIGLGLVGLLAAQIARAAGAFVIGIDRIPSRLELAKSLGVEEVISSEEPGLEEQVNRLTEGIRADCILMCAPSHSSEVVNKAMTLARYRGRVVLVGRTPLNLERTPFLMNELDLRYSRAYGAGLYLDSYERHGFEIPKSLVRWTAGRNIEAFLGLVRSKKVSVEELISKVYPFEKAAEVYQQIGQTDTGKGVAILLEHSVSDKDKFRSSVLTGTKKRAAPSQPILGIVGAGRFMRGYRAPGLMKAGARIAAVAAKSGASAKYLATKVQAELATTDYHEILNNSEISAVVVATRHNLHSKIAATALRGGKTVFVEKPMALSKEGVLEIVKAAEQSENDNLFVGYNRRHSRVISHLHKRLNKIAGPRIIDYFVCVPPIPEDHWTLDPTEGGGRIIAECDHFFDLCNFLVGARPVQIIASAMDLKGKPLQTATRFQVRIVYANESIAVLTYTDCGSSCYPRESIRVNATGVVAEVSDFKRLILYNTKKNTMKLSQPDMGFVSECQKWLDIVSGKRNYDVAGLRDGLYATGVSLAAIESLKTGLPADLPVDF